MKTVFNLLLISVIVFGFCIGRGAGTANLPPPEVWLTNSSLDPESGENTTGSATLIAVQGDQLWFLTAKHVIPVATVGGLPVNMVLVHPILDIALLRAKTEVPGEFFPSVIGSPPGALQRVYSMGWHQGRFLMLTEGYTAVGEKPTTSCFITHGCSGGAVFNEKNHLIGIINSIAVRVMPTMMGDKYAVPLTSISHYTPINLFINWMNERISNAK